MPKILIVHGAGMNMRGNVQNEAEFVHGVVTRKAVVTSLDFPELTLP